MRQKLSQGEDLALRGYLYSAGYLLQLHPSVYKTLHSEPESHSYQFSRSSIYSRSPFVRFVHHSGR